MNDLPESALYLGRIRHRRLREPEHSFNYRVWHALIDLDQIPNICQKIAVLSHNRFNVLGFYDRDHMGPKTGSVRHKLNRWLADQSVQIPDGKVFLLTGLRHFGYGFNPVSFYFCHDAGGSLHSVIAEVNNTFGETFCYLLDSGGDHSAIRDQSKKTFHVSPFQPIEGDYRFLVTAPGERLSVHIDLIREDRRVFDATLTSDRMELTTKTLLAALAGHAHLSAMTVARIHWQALKLWRRGATFYTKPAMPDEAWRTRNG